MLGLPNPSKIGEEIGFQSTSALPTPLVSILRGEQDSGQSGPGSPNTAAPRRSTGRTRRSRRKQKRRKKGRGKVKQAVADGRCGMRCIMEGARLAGMELAGVGAEVNLLQVRCSRT
jgi:hypothetical protein